MLFGLPLAITDGLSHTTTLSYDGAGKLMGMVNAVGLSASVTYNMAGTSRIEYSGWLPSTMVNALNNRSTVQYGGAGRAIAITDALGNTAWMGKLIAEYGGVATGSGLEYMTGDHLGSTRLVTSASSPFQPRRVDYLPYGETLLSGVRGRTAAGGYETAEGVGVLSVRFTGKERDGETASSMGPGMDYFGARYFSGAMGRCLSPDRICFQKEMLDGPQRFNLYAYARNNPLKFVDPTGEAIELSSDPAERQKQMEALCGIVGNDVCKQYLYVDATTKKGHYYVGIYSGGSSGQGPDFGSLNGVTAALNGIITDRKIATINLVHGGDRFGIPGGGRTSLNQAGAGGATVPMNGRNDIYVRANDDPRGYSSLMPWQMSNW